MDRTGTTWLFHTPPTPSTFMRILGNFSNVHVLYTVESYHLLPLKEKKKTLVKGYQVIVSKGNLSEFVQILNNCSNYILLNIWLSLEFAHFRNDSNLLLSKLAHLWRKPWFGNNGAAPFTRSGRNCHDSTRSAP